MSTKPQRSSDSVESFLKGRLSIPQALGTLKEKYENAKPFKHIVIDHLFSDLLIEKITHEIPPLNKGNWIYNNDEHLVNYNLRSAVQLGENGDHLTALLHSAAFLYFLSELTGIWELLPDPYLQGAGFRTMPSGGKFDVHVDRNTAYETGLIRRLALIIYLNKSWSHEYGGQLELWNSCASHCEATIEPIFNRTVLFELADDSFHGVRPVSCPNGRSRDSFAVYYHTAAINSGKEIAPHSSIYAPVFYDSKKLNLREIIKDVTPPALWRCLKMARMKKVESHGSHGLLRRFL